MPIFPIREIPLLLPLSFQVIVLFLFYFANTLFPLNMSIFKLFFYTTRKKNTHPALILLNISIKCFVISVRFVFYFIISFFFFDTKNVSNSIRFKCCDRQFCKLFKHVVWLLRKRQPFGQFVLRADGKGLRSPTTTATSKSCIICKL